MISDLTADKIVSEPLFCIIPALSRVQEKGRCRMMKAGLKKWAGDFPAPAGPAHTTGHLVPHSKNPVPLVLACGSDIEDLRSSRLRFRL
jgi:hypothetical protein